MPEKPVENPKDDKKKTRPRIYGSSSPSPESSPENLSTSVTQPSVDQPSLLRQARPIQRQRSEVAGAPEALVPVRMSIPVRVPLYDPSLLTSTFSGTGLIFKSSAARDSRRSVMDIPNQPRIDSNRNLIPFPLDPRSLMGILSQPRNDSIRNIPPDPRSVVDIPSQPRNDSNRNIPPFPPPERWSALQMLADRGESIDQMERERAGNSESASNPPIQSTSETKPPESELHDIFTRAYLSLECLTENLKFVKDGEAPGRLPVSYHRASNADLESESSDTYSKSSRSGSCDTDRKCSESGCSDIDNKYTEFEPSDVESKSPKLKPSEPSDTASKFSKSESSDKSPEFDPCVVKANLPESYPNYAEAKSPEPFPIHAEAYFSGSDPSDPEAKSPEFEPSDAEAYFPESDPSDTEAKFSEPDPSDTEAKFLELDPSVPEAKFPGKDPSDVETKFPESYPSDSEAKFPESYPCDSEAKFSESDHSDKKAEFSESYPLDVRSYFPESDPSDSEAKFPESYPSDSEAKFPESDHSDKKAECSESYPLDVRSYFPESDPSDAEAKCSESDPSDTEAKLSESEESEMIEDCLEPKQCDSKTGPSEPKKMKKETPSFEPKQCESKVGPSEPKKMKNGKESLEPKRWESIAGPSEPKKIKKDTPSSESKQYESQAGPTEPKEIKNGRESLKPKRWESIAGPSQPRESGFQTPTDSLSQPKRCKEGESSQKPTTSQVSSKTLENLKKLLKLREDGSRAPSPTAFYTIEIENDARSDKDSGSSKTRKRAAPESSPQGNKIESEINPADMKCMDLYDTLKFPDNLRSNHGPNVGLPSMSPTLKSVREGITALRSHIDCFTRFFIKECCRSKLNKKNMENFKLAYTTFKEEECPKILDLLYITLSGLKEYDEADRLLERLCMTELSLNRLHFAYFMIRMFQMYPSKVKEISKQIEDLGRTVNSIKEWTDYGYSDSDTN